jgi:hypothetical protein
VAGLQLADLLAHPLKRDVLRDKGVLTETPSDFERRLLGVVTPKYNRRLGDKRVEGYGRILV